MEKKRLLILLLLIISITSAFFLTVFVSAQNEPTQIKKAYGWLQGRTIGKWTGLDIKQHVFSLLALRDKLTQEQIEASLKALMQKSYGNGTCWPSICNAVDTAIAKIALDSFGKDAKASEWLLDKTIIPVLDLQYYLQLIQPLEANETRCLIVYDNIEHEISIDEHGKLSSRNLGNCFSIDNYWLKLNPQCINKTFNISCDKNVKANFLFKKDNEWYVTTTIDVPPLGVGSLELKTRCIASATKECDYEATLWTAYAFMLSGRIDIARSFVPYLVMKAAENKRFLPEAFLFKITGKESYADYIATRQGTDGFILAPNTAYNKYYDSALAKLTGSAEKTNLTKLKQRLLYEQKKDGSWECFGCNTIRETAILLYAFWPAYEWLSECEIQGYNCVANCSAAGGSRVNYYCNEGECCNITFTCEQKYGTCKASCSALLNETQVPYGCASGVCCKNYSISLCVTEIRGQKCSENQKCYQGSIIVPFVHAADTSYCCLGVCSAAQQTCSQQGGIPCDPNKGYSCEYGRWLLAIDENFCCEAAYCKQEQQTCSQQGGIICRANEYCKDGTLVVASDTQGKAACCVQGGICIPKTCNYKKCEENETCIGDVFETLDAKKCCNGKCLKKCYDLGGVPCNATMECKGTLREAADTSRCCIGKCQKKTEFPWWLIIIFTIAVIIAVALFYFFKRRKPKAKPRIEFGFPPITPARITQLKQTQPTKPTQPVSEKKKLPPVPKPGK